MRFKDIAKKRNRANFSADLSIADPHVPYRHYRANKPFWQRYWEAATSSERVQLCVDLIEERIKDEGRFPNWSVRYFHKSKEWNRAVRIVNAKRKGVRE